MSKTTTQGLLFLVDYETLEDLAIQFVPSELNMSRQAFIGQDKIIARNEQSLQFTGGATTISLSLEFYGQDVIEKVNFIKKFTYNDGDKQPANRLKLIWGDLIPSNALWVVQSANTNYSQFMPAENFNPRRATVELILLRSTDTNITRSQIGF